MLGFWASVCEKGNYWADAKKWAFSRVPLRTATQPSGHFRFLTAPMGLLQLGVFAGAAGYPPMPLGRLLCHRWIFARGLKARSYLGAAWLLAGAVCRRARSKFSHIHTFFTHYFFVVFNADFKYPPTYSLYAGGIACAKSFCPIQSIPICSCAYETPEKCPTG